MWTFVSLVCETDDVENDVIDQGETSDATETAAALPWVPTQCDPIPSGW